LEPEDLLVEDQSQPIRLRSESTPARTAISFSMKTKGTATATKRAPTPRLRSTGTMPRSLLPLERETEISRACCSLVISRLSGWEKNGVGVEPAVNPQKTVKYVGHAITVTRP